jgi:CRISPR-associated protein Csx17
MGAHLAPIDPVKPWQWKSDSRMVVRTSGNLTSSLFSILERRLVETARHNNKDNPLSGWPPADKAAVAAFLAGETNDRFVFELLSGLVRTQMPSTPLPTRQINQDGIFPAAFRLLKPLFTTNRQLQKANLLASDQHLPLPLSLPRLLRAGRIQEAMDFSMRRLRASGLPSSFKCLHASGISGTRLAAALIIPMFTRDIVFLTSGILHNLSPVSNKGV